MTYTDPPLVDLKVTNPITYIKKWWAKVLGNEGMEMKFKVSPLVVLAMTIIVASIAFGVGRFSMVATAPFIKYDKVEDGERSRTTTPTTGDPWRETAFTGTVQYSNTIGRYYLLTTTSSEAINLDVPSNISLGELVGKRIFAAGKYNKTTRTLVVATATDLEILPKKPSTVPTTTPTPTQTVTTEPDEVNPLN